MFFVPIQLRQSFLSSCCFEKWRDALNTVTPLAVQTISVMELHFRTKKRNPANTFPIFCLFVPGLIVTSDWRQFCACRAGHCRPAFHEPAQEKINIIEMPGQSNCVSGFQSEGVIKLGGGRLSAIQQPRFPL